MSYDHKKLFHSLKPQWKIISLTGAALLILSLVLAWISTGFKNFSGWQAFLIVTLISTGLLWILWRLIRVETPPKWLYYLLICAAILRILIGALWYIALPVWGHGSPAEQSGYIMADASARDQAAWDLAQSGKSLWKAFRNNRAVDQYGGMLFFNALTYRLLGTDQHMALLIVVLCATISSSAILFIYTFAKRAWNKDIAAVAALILAFYPEAVLLGSSQMREAFTIPLTIAAFYGLMRYQQEKKWISVSWMIIPLLLFIPFSPPFAALVLGFLILTALATSNRLPRDLLKKSSFWLIFSVLVILIFAGLWITLKQFTPEGMNNPISMVNWWLRKSASFQAYLSKHASGWMQEIFKNTPQWTHLAMLLAYGVVQPFLPAAIVVGSHAPIWRWITLWRSIGWSLLLVFLIYAPFITTRKHKENISLTRILLLITWFVILLAAFRGGGDMWDNPRYRATFASLQIVLVAWVWVQQRQSPDPWLRRAVITIGSVAAWFIPWYLQRYYSIGWLISDPFITLGLGIHTGVLLCVWDWVRTGWNNNNSGEETN